MGGDGKTICVPPSPSCDQCPHSDGNREPQLYFADTCSSLGFVIVMTEIVIVVGFGIVVDNLNFHTATEWRILIFLNWFVLHSFVNNCFSCA